MVTRPEGSAFDISTTISTKNYRLVTDWTFVSATSASRFIGSNAPEYSDKDVVREKVERWDKSEHNGDGNGYRWIRLGKVSSHVGAHISL